MPFTRHNLFMRDKNLCQYCGIKLSNNDITIDHVHPKSLGGETSWKNCVVACAKCNRKKDNKTLSQSGMKLLHTPFVPMWRPDFVSKIKISSWDKFISAIYWNIELSS